MRTLKNAFWLTAGRGAADLVLILVAYPASAFVCRLAPDWRRSVLFGSAAYLGSAELAGAHEVAGHLPSS